MYHTYLAPVALLFVSIVIFKFVFKKINRIRGKRIEGFEEGKKKNIPTPNDQGVKLLYEIRGMVLSDQNDIDKQIQLLSEKRDTSVVLDKMTELENLLKGKTQVNIDPSEDYEQTKEADGDDDGDDGDGGGDDDGDDDSDGDDEDDEDLEEPEEVPVQRAKKKVKAKATKPNADSAKDTKKKPRKLARQPVDESSDDESGAGVNGDVVEGFVEGIEYHSSATNCFEV